MNKYFGERSIILFSNKDIYEQNDKCPFSNVWIRVYSDYNNLHHCIACKIETQYRK